MINLRDNRGMTLVELIVTIAIGSIITLAATTILLLGLRIYKQSNDTVTRQNQVRIGMTVIEDLLTQNPVVGVDDGTTVLTTENKKLLRFDEATGRILTGSNGVVMEDVTGFEASLDPTCSKLITVKIEIGDEEYPLTVYSREDPPVQEESPDDGAAEAEVFSENSSENVLTSAISNRKLTPQVRAFLKTLNSQMGSTGRILTEDGEGEYYSQWYIGSYEDNPGWNEETPWCACFVSWALDECGGYLKGQIPRFANVDSFWAEFVTTDNWKTENPEAGDIVFFDWIVDDEYNPQHVGVVAAVEDGWIYTIEGNANGLVTLCRYACEDARIMGYGVLNWA